MSFYATSSIILKSPLSFAFLIPILHFKEIFLVDVSTSAKLEGKHAQDGKKR